MSYYDGDNTRITMQHPTDRPNFSIVRISGDGGHLSLAFSYSTIVGISDGGRWHVCENVWSVTTGKHLNWLNENKSERMDRDEFLELVETITARLAVKPAKVRQLPDSTREQRLRATG